MAACLSELEISVIEAIEGDMPLVKDPFGEIAAKLGVSRDEVLDCIRSLKKKGIIRRLAGVLNHRRSGYMSNGMLVCRPAEPGRIGRKLSESKCVSHCYRRRSYAGWPYNLYAMIHAESRAGVEDEVQRLATENALGPFEVLYSTEEIKKSSLRAASLLQKTFQNGEEK